MQDKDILVSRRYSAPPGRVFTEAARALTDLGYTVVTRDSGATEGLLQAAARFTWDDCVTPDVAAASKHPGVVVFAGTRTERDSTEFRVGAHTLTKVPNVLVRGERMNADLIVKMCAIISVTARVDTLLGEHGPAPPPPAESLALAPAAVPAPGTSAYQHLVQRLRGGDTLVDYTALRMAYAKTPQYEPYPVRWEANQAMFAALERRKFAEVRSIADSILSTNYVDPDAHLGAMAAAYSLGDSARGAFHAAVYRGLIASIGKRSGRTPDSAIIVLSIPEEYALLRALGLERTTVAGVQCGRSFCDQIEVTSRETGKRSVLYFDVSIPLAWGANRFRRR